MGVDVVLTNNNYYSDKYYMSVSRYKQMLKCEGNIDFESPTEAMLQGAYVDAYVEGTLDEFKENNPSIIATTGKNKGQLKSSFKICEDICKFLDEDKISKQFLSGEKQTIMVGSISDVPFKIKMDSYVKGKCIVDLKVMSTIRKKGGKRYNFIREFGYDTQLACYQEIVRQNTGEVLPCYILVVTKECPIESVVVEIPQYALDDSLLEVKQNINRLYDVFVGNTPAVYCGHCSNCIKNKRYERLISLESLDDCNKKGDNCYE